jgi:hypothetical protein
MLVLATFFPANDGSGREGMDFVGVWKYRKNKISFILVVIMAVKEKVAELQYVQWIPLYWFIRLGIVAGVWSGGCVLLYNLELCLKRPCCRFDRVNSSYPLKKVKYKYRGVWTGYHCMKITWHYWLCPDTYPTCRLNNCK